MNKLNCDIIKDLLPLYVDGVVSESSEAEIRRHLEQCASCRKEYQDMTAELIVPTSEQIQQESTIPLRKMKTKLKRFLILSTLLVLLLAGTAALLLANREVEINANSIDWNDGITIVDLSPGDEIISEFTIELEKMSDIYYTIGWGRMGLTLEYGLCSNDGTVFSVEMEGGHDTGKFKNVPAGQYRLFVRNSGDYEGLPAYEDPESDVSFDATGAFLYSIE